MSLKRYKMNFNWSILFLLLLIDESLGNLPPVFTTNLLTSPLVKEDTPVGSPVFSLAAKDPEGSRLKYGIQGTDSLIVDAKTGVVTVSKQLDREEKETLRLVVTVEDEVPGGAHNNVVRVPLSVGVLDVNDNQPVFSRDLYETWVAEDADVGSTVLGGILLSDVDIIGDDLSIVCYDGDKPCDEFAISPESKTSRSFRGSLVLKKALSYMQRQRFNLSLIASDGQNMATSPLLLKVKDVQNTPPRFKGSTTGVVAEDAPIGSHVMTLQAHDRDVGDPRVVMYELISNPLDFFILDPKSGELSTAKPLDRESVPDPAGVVTLTVRAYELEGGSRAQDAASWSTTSVQVTIRDVNDEAPTFDRNEYRVSIPENLPPDTPVPDLHMIVTDTDSGSNTLFSIRLADTSDGRFSITPAEASGSTSLSLRVSKGGLDYENPNERKFLLVVVATEIATKRKLSSSATIVLQITDTNDNSPVFEREAYTALLSETASAGSVVMTIVASDADAGSFGQDGIRYLLFGNGAEKFIVDQTSGVITVAPCETPGRNNCLDYETKSTYFLSLQAIDENGKGHETVVPLRISLRDANDNPPRFSAEVYRAVIQEGEARFDPPLVVKALDPDVTSQIKYSIVGGDPAGLFHIDESSGEIQVSDPAGLDISNFKLSEILLTVEASDGVGSHSAKIRVRVHDVNNNKPLFSQVQYEAAVQENAHIGTIIEEVQATDADAGENAAIEYSIMLGAFDDFVVNASTGVVLVNKKLNFDRRSLYHIEIVANDRGVPRFSSPTILKISIIDNNDKNPYFMPTTQRVKVKEDASVGSVIHTLVARDQDVSEEGGLRFESEATISAVDDEGKALGKDQIQSIEGLFSVDSTGQVTLVGTLNRNVTTEVTLSVFVTDVTANSPQKGQGQLVITIVDVNDHPPTFAAPWQPDRPFISVSVTEELPPGSVVAALTAHDVDSSIARYELVEPSSAAVTVDEATGVVTVAGRLDYEQSKTVRATVVATDTGIPPKSATATLVINLENINDEEPVFEHPIYDGEVAEHSAGGTSVLRVQATDNDAGNLGSITYSLAGDHQQFFMIDSTGLIKVTPGVDLDREKLSEMRLRAVATDSGPQDTRKQTSVPIHIKILDTNDHHPVFEQRTFSASVGENLSLDPPVPVLQVKATDGDEGINAALAYVITGGSGKDLFHVDRTTGILYPAKRLLAPEKKMKYELTVEVRDLNGTGSVPDRAKVTILVLPRNVHKPIFAFPPKSFTAKVPEESLEPELLVMTVRATDGDEGANGDVRYHLRVNDDNVQETNTFRIHPVSGELYTKRVLDREEREKYELVLVAKDHGSPISYETLRVVSVEVSDVNDHAPSFPDSGRTYTFAVAENKPQNAVVGQVIATDLDIGDNARIFYLLLGGNLNGSFRLDKSSGSLFTTRPLDRELMSSYKLHVAATNDPNSVSKKTLLKSSQAFIVVNVDDENDTPPTFARDTFYAGVPFTAEVENTVRSVRAQDADRGYNSSLTYTIRSSKFFRPGQSKAMGSIVPSPFNVTKDGQLLTATLMAPYRQHRFLLELQAKEDAPPHRTDTCFVNIWVWERDELVKVVFEQRPSEVMGQREEITVELSRVLEGRAVIDEVRYFTHANNSVSREWTEVLMHVVNDSSDVLPTKEVLRRVDRGYPELRNSKVTATIREIAPARSRPSETEVDARIAGLIALVVALVVGLISFVVVCCCLRFWVMSPAKSREHLIHRVIDEDLGVNTTENPLWVDQKLKTYEEQELSMHVMSEFDAAAIAASQQAMQAANGVPTNVAAVNLDAQSNTYATIQKSHGGTIRSLQLRSLQQSLNPAGGGDVNYDGNDYATLDNLRRANGVSKGRQGPRVPGVETPLSTVFAHDRESPELQELVTSFTGSTFQPPDSSHLANRPLPEEPEFVRQSREYSDHKSLSVNANGEPCLVAELI